MTFRFLALLPVVASLTIACSEASPKNEGPHDNGVPFVFGASGADAIAWAARARQETSVELVTREFVNERSVYTAIGREDLDRHAQTATYVLVRRWLTMPRLLELDALAKVVFEDLSNHLATDIKAITDGNTMPPAQAPTNQLTPNPASPASQILSSVAELQHQPSALGGYGVVMCTLHLVAFVPPVPSSESSKIADKAKAGLPLSDQERRQQELDRIRELLTNPAK